MHDILLVGCATRAKAGKQQRRIMRKKQQNYPNLGIGGIKRREKTLLKVTRSTLANLFGVSKYTIKRWVRAGLLNPRDLLDIIDKYLNRWKIDKRMSPPTEETSD